VKAYVITTGSIFGLIVVAHILRVIEEGTHLARDPFWMLLTVGAAALSLWAWRLLRLLPRSP
jgi:predicted ABC-type sugar transport system permease subunit